jgi:DNA-binding PadR family transcriptional regulator
MYKDNSLIPSEAVRLAALGILTQGPRPYAALSGEVRHFSDRIVGPSLDMTGPSLELLRIEGLIESDGRAAAAEAQLLRITEAGSRELRHLLTARLRGATGEFNKLVIALKMRFLHLLDPAARAAQIGLLVDTCEAELKRLSDLRRHHAAEPGPLLDWLDHDIAQIETRAAWFRSLGDRAPAG